MKNSKFTHNSQVVMALAMAAAAPVVLADPVSWIGSDGAWENTANWAGGALPTVDDFADLPFLVAVSSTASANVAKELTNRAALSVTAGKLAVTGTVDNFGALTVNGGAALDAGRINVDSSAAFAVNGAGTAVNVVQGVFNYGDWNMGAASILNAESFDNFGTLNFAGGAVATANSMINHSGATATLSGAATGLVIHGNLTNDGEVHVDAGAELNTHSIDNNAALVVNQGRVQTDSQINVGSLKVSGANAQYNAVDLVTNRGSIEVLAGGTADIKQLDNHATVSVDGAELRGQSFKNDLDSTLSVSNGATVSFDAAINASRFGISIDGVDAKLQTGTFQQLSGTTAINGGTLGASSAFGAQILGGELLGHGAIDGKLVLDANGVLTPGDSADATQRFTVAGGLALLGGRFDVDLGGTAAADYDVIDAQGAALLGGTLQVSLQSGYVPVLGDAFDIILADSINGAFGTLLLPTLGDGLKFTTLNGGSFFRLQVAAVPLPTPALLLGGALGVLGFARRRRSRTA